MGKYYLRVADSQRKGGPDFVYRLQIRPPRPDFELRVTPSAVIARPGTSMPITVHALRKEEFTEDITLSLDKPPAGYKLTGGWIPGDQDKVRCTLTVPTAITPEPISLQMEGHSMGRGRKLTRMAVPAESMMQAFAYFHLVPTKDFTVMVSGGGRNDSKASLAFAGDAELRMPLGATVKLRVMSLAKRPPPSELTMELSEPPDGITIEKVTPLSSGIEVALTTDAKKVKSGLKGNLIFKAFREYTPPAIEGALPPKPRRTALGYMPAVPFEVLGKGPRQTTKTTASR
jgi:hypothetical protein